ncbi:uncharacterized protein [Montipora foliosa]|uniref:uncharacterized protein n=1 Tax=Montipora foliosa TaxID=591990 RepID=UPI0035F1D218
MASDSEQKLSRIEQWRKKKAEEKKTKNRAYYEGNQKQLIRKNSEYRESRKSSSQRKSKRHNVKQMSKNKARSQRAKETLKKEEKRKALQRERAKRYRENVKTSTEYPQNSSSEEPKTFPSRMAKKRALDKAKKAMPSTPSKKANILLEMSSSPRTRSILVKKGKIRTPEEENEIEALKAVAQDLNEGLSSIKIKKTNSGRAAYTAAKSLAFGEVVKKKRSQKTLSKIFSLDRRSISKSIEKRIKILKGEESCWLAKKRQTRRDALSDETKKLVYDFWTQSVSRPTGNKNEVLRKRVRPKESIEHPKHVLEVTQTEAFQKFQKEHPNVKIKQRKFESLKPFFVKGAKERDRQTCMCRQHVEVQMVFKDCMKVRSHIVEKEGVDTTIYSSLAEIISVTLCPVEAEKELHNLACLKRECTECGVNLFSLLPQEQSSEGKVKWKRYDYLPTGKFGADGKEIKKISLVSKETAPKELFAYLYTLLESFPYHSFLAKWERQQCDQLIMHLPLGHSICIHDYSESYACRYQDEIQSQYFNMDKVSIHVTVLYRHASLRYNGLTSTEEKPEVVKEYIFGVSDDVTQDHDSVLHMQKLISAYLKDEVKINITKMHEFTDGCAGQYKSRHCFGDLSCSLQHLGYVAQRNFFATSHAKGEQDAAGSHVKQKATSEVLRRNATISNAEDLCTFLRANFSEPSSSSFSSRKNAVDLKRKVFFYIPASGTQSIPRNRPDGNFRTIKGIRQLHSVRACSEQLKIYVRERACYCFSCLEEQYDECENQQWVEPWREIHLQREPSAAQTRSVDDAGDIEHSVQLAELAVNGSVVAIAADEDLQYDYYLLKVVSDGVVRLESDFEDDYGSIFSCGQSVLLGHFFLRENLIDFTFKLEGVKRAAVLSGTVRHICRDLVLKSKETKRRKAIYKLPITEHEEIIASL